MKALILNSGMGTRMDKELGLVHKCMAEITPGVPLLSYQLDALIGEGITDFVITTGHADKAVTAFVKERYGTRYGFDFVFNPMFAQTNYIYSMYLAREFLDGDILLMHGDLYFDKALLTEIIASHESAVVIDRAVPITDKDFKARVIGDRVTQIATYITDEQCVSCQPLYKLPQPDWLIWKQRIGEFCQRGDTAVYAEEALNTVLDTVILKPLEAAGRVCMEIDTAEDLYCLREKI